MKDSYTYAETADLLEQAEKLKIQLYSENTLNDVDVLINQELLKSLGTKENYMGQNPDVTFGGALYQLHAGQKVARKGWKAHHALGLQVPDENYTFNSLPYIYMIIGHDASDMQGKRVPWVASQTDLLAEDWIVVFAQPK